VKWSSWLTTARSWHGPASVRRPSRLLYRQRGGVTPVADRVALPQLNRGNRRAALASARGPWPCSLGDRRWADSAYSVGSTSIYASSTTEAAEPLAKATAAILVVRPPPTPRFVAPRSARTHARRRPGDHELETRRRSGPMATRAPRRAPSAHALLPSAQNHACGRPTAASTCQRPVSRARG
jgi:hypothetical protein